MLLKHADDKTGDLESLARLLTRGDLSKTQRSAIEKEMQNIRTGDRGERDVAYFLDNQMKDSTNNLVMHDLRLEIDGEVAQIDHLVISRVHRVYVIETKSLNATLQCNEAGEWTAWYGAHKRGTPVAIASPIEQARRHVELLDKWLKRHGWSNFKHFEPIVLVSPTTFVGKTRAKGDEKFQILRADLFRRWWENEREIGGLADAVWRIASRLSLVQLEELGSLLNAEHRPSARNWAARFGVQPEPERVVAPVVVPMAAVAPVAVVAPAVEPAVRVAAAASVPDEVVTSFGPVSIKRVTDGRYALRHGDDAALRAHVQAVGSAHGVWQARFRNWLVPADRIAIVVAALVAADTN